MKRTALVEIRALPAQAVGAIAIANELEERGFKIVYIANKIPAWFRQMYPQISANTVTISTKRISLMGIWVMSISIFRTLWTMPLFSLKNLQSHWLSMRLLGVPVGDLLADSALRARGATAGKVLFLLQVFRSGAQAHRILSTVNRISRIENIQVIVSSSRSYASVHGLLTRFGHWNEITVYNNAPTFFAQTSLDRGIFSRRNEARKDVADFVRRTAASLEFQKTLDDFLLERFSTTSLNRDYRQAYERDTPRENAERAQWLSTISRLAKTSRRRVIFVAPHVFSDAVFMEGYQLFGTYLRWYESTIRIVRNIPDALWITKEHPSADQYGETGLVRGIVDRYTLQSKQSNIHFAPNSVRPSDILALSDAVVTVRGTVGMEFGAHGKLCVLAGNANYSHLGFSVSPASVSEYVSILHLVARDLPTAVRKESAVAALFFLEAHLTASSMPESAFAAGVNGGDAQSYGAVAQYLENVRQQGNDAYLAKIKRTLNGEGKLIVE